MLYSRFGFKISLEQELIDNSHVLLIFDFSKVLFQDCI